MCENNTKSHTNTSTSTCMSAYLSMQLLIPISDYSDGSIQH